MMIGNRLSGRYKILEMIGGGGMANVYLAHDMILDRDVAVKVLRMDFANSEEFIRRFHREAQSATSLAHPNIVTIYDVGEEDSIYYIVMEYVNGQTLKEYIQQDSPIPIQVALTIMEQILSAISHAHQNHIIHRDIKPQNILFDRNGNVKITDFGIAMALSATSITQTNSVLGSVHYLSPEQARGAVANHQSDIYSLGIVMFELLTGRLPFSGESAVSIALKHLQSETPSLRRWLPNLPQSVENIVLKATAKDPFHRYVSVEEMEEDLRTALEPERLNEPKFTVPIDGDATKAMPVITDEQVFSNLEETIIHGKEPKRNVAASELEQENNHKKSRKVPIVLLSIFTVLIILVILTVTVLPALFIPKDIEIPEVAGKTIDQAVSELETAGFVIGEETEEISDPGIQAGLVVKTKPRAGRMAKPGSEVIIYQSTGKPTTEMKDYTGLDYDDVKEDLEDEGFKHVDKEEVYHDDPAGTILGQNYSVGEHVVPEETDIVFTISKGPEPITINDLTRYTNSDVRKYAESNGLRVAVLPEEFHDTIPEGQVVYQIPQEGVAVEEGSTIQVAFSKGPEELPFRQVKEVIMIPYDPVVEEEGEVQEGEVQEGEVQEEEQEEKQEKPQHVQIFIEDVDNNITELYDEYMITEDTTVTIELTIAHGTVGYYKVMRDNQVFSEKTVPYPE